MQNNSGADSSRAPAKSAQPEISIVILCYRAEEAIVPFVERVIKLLEWTKADYELVLVGNYWPQSDDKTPAIVAGLAAKNPRIKGVTLPKAGAMGWDVKSGIAQASGKYIAFIDGDGQFPVESILSPVYCALSSLANEDTSKGSKQNSSVDLVKTYRVVRGDGLYRICISFCYNLLFKFLFGTNYRDINSKPKVIRSEILRTMSLTSDDWFIDAEIMIKAHQQNLKVVEIPIHFIENEHRASFVKFSAIWEFIKNLWKFRRIYSK